MVEDRLLETIEGDGWEGGEAEVHVLKSGLMVGLFSEREQAG